MNLYLISQVENNGYDTYDSAVVAALNEDSARLMNPKGGKIADGEDISWYWTSPNLVKVQFIGIANLGTPEGVICSSFNAG